MLARRNRDKLRKVPRVAGIVAACVAVAVAVAVFAAWALVALCGVIALGCQGKNH